MRPGPKGQCPEGKILREVYCGPSVLKTLKWFYSPIGTWFQAMLGLRGLRGRGGRKGPGWKHRHTELVGVLGTEYNPITGGGLLQGPGISEPGL